MMDFLNFAFQDFWHFIGVLILICAPLGFIAEGLAALGRR